MYKNAPLKLVLLLTCFFMITCSGVSNSFVQETQPKATPHDELYNTIAYMDSLLFDAFNKHDLEKLKTLFTEDLEFYHDKGGLTNYSQNMEAFKNTFAQNNGLKRELVAGSLEVYPVKEYGAMQIGMHRFCHAEKGKQECGIFKFVHIWKKKNKEWKISRVISYDH